MSKNTIDTKKHIPVLLSEVTEHLKPKVSDSYLDLTAGYGGHAAALLQAIGHPAQAVLVDRDEAAATHLRKLFAGDSRVRVMHSDFANASQELADAHAQFDMILADLGVASPHLDEASRGFSLLKEGPLDMRMDAHQDVTAADIVNNATEAKLVRVLRDYGDVYGAHRIARLICSERPLKSTTDLATLVARAYPGYHKIHPATKVFQALRIAVNQELDQLAASLPIWVRLLKPGGRLAVISFHSLEDRLVKQFLQDHGGQAYDAQLGIVTRRPITAGATEIVHNPRARSAKLRVAVKIKIREE